MNTMQSKIGKTAGALMLGALCAFVTGCGFVGGRGAPSAASAYNTDWSPIFAAVTRTGGVYDIYSVNPNQGPLAGGNRAELIGVFPDPALALGGVAEIASLYTVYFGFNAAAYDVTAVPIISSALINVTVPPGAAPGFVDVIFRENATQLDAATLYYGYEYLDPFAITAVDPNIGPIAGGQQVTVYGRYPIAAPITTVAQADASYRVYIDSRPAAFDPAFNPVITAGAMYVITPPGVAPNAPGLVDVSVATVEASPQFRVLPLSYEYIGALDLYRVVPDRWFIFGDAPARIEGTFPVSRAFSDALAANQASLYYTAYFGYRIAPFDQTVPNPVITPTDMYVRIPPSDTIGFVDVRVEDATNRNISDTLSRAFRYYALYITNVVPNSGSCGGGDLVRIEGLIPAFDSIRTVAEAYMYYTVTFGGSVADFADQGGAPIILPSQIDTINRTYTTGYMYVLTPPGAAGFVNVAIFDNLGFDLPAIALDAFDYNCGGEISRWNNTIVAPNPVGKLESGELSVTVTGVGEMTNHSSDPVFIVPQGGDPARSADRIELDEDSYVESGGEFTWIGTNRNPIPRIMHNDLLVDGHAAVYIELVDGTILGDNVADPTDGGIIQPNATNGRHFIIDTIPPRLMLNGATGHLRGDDFVNPMMAENWTVNDVDTGTRPTTQLNPHPYDYLGLAGQPSLGGTANGYYDAPFDGSWMYHSDTAQTRAQVFFNVSSLTNNFEDSLPDGNGLPTRNLQFTLTATFEDIDIYTALDWDPAVGSNGDRFANGSTIRQVAGFENNLNVTRSGNLLRDEALTSRDDVLIQWDFQPTAFRLPQFYGVSTTYTSTGALSAGANPGLSSNLVATPTVLVGNFVIGDPSDPTGTGVDLSEVGSRTLMSVILRAVDRAGDYTPLRNTKPGTKKLYTRNDLSAFADGGYAQNMQPEMGPLNLWWLRTTATRVTSNIPPSGDTRTASFSWENTAQPDPQAVADTSDGDGAVRRYSYAIYKTDAASGPRDQQRDGRYNLAVPWSPWTTVTALTAVDVQNLITANVPANQAEGVWFLLVVMSVDEAGNIELWPEDQLRLDPSPIAVGPLTIASVDNLGGTEERNWDRWFVPSSGEAVDTRIEPFYWHDSVVNGAPLEFDAGEPSFGDAEVVPYPPRTTFDPPVRPILERVAARFRISVITDQTLANVEYELLENGQSVFVPPLVANAVGGTVLVTLPFEPPTPSFLGSRFRQPTYYTFRATTFIDANGDGELDRANEIYDTSPATVKFVVVENVANYIQNRKSEDTQPIQEMDRP